MSAPYQKSEADQKIVEALAAVGIPHAEIGAAIGIGYTTLEKHYKEVLATAATRANGRVATTLFALATSGKDTAATIFWTKCRLRWQEVSRVEHTHVNGSVDVEARELLAIVSDELKDHPELLYRIAQRFHRQHQEQSAELKMIEGGAVN
jgi:hypothetical protein